MPWLAGAVIACVALVAVLLANAPPAPPPEPAGEKLEITPEMWKFINNATKLYSPGHR